MSFRPRYDPDVRKTRRLMTSPQMQALMRRRAERGADYAESIAPRETGEYAASFRVEPGAAEDRAEAVLRNTSDHAVPVELKHRVLARTVDHLEGKGG